MWVRILESGQELDMHPDRTQYGPGAKALIAGGHAVEVPPPTKREPDLQQNAYRITNQPKGFTTFDVDADTTDEDIKKVAKEFAYKTGTNHLWELVAYTMKLQRQVKFLELRLAQGSYAAR